MVRPATNHYTADPAETVEALEHRVRRLEDAVAALQDTQIMEDRVVERVVQRIDQVPLSLSESHGLIVDAPRLLPRMLEAMPEDGSADANSNSTATAIQSTWLLIDLFREFQAILRMCTDYRYRMTWMTRIVLLAAIVVVILSLLVIGNIPWIGGLLDRVVLVMVVVVVYKVLAREVVRYRELLARIRRYR